jgi:hypothetical protein
MLAGTPRAIEQQEHAPCGPTAFGGAFVGMAFKQGACTRPCPSKRLKLHVAPGSCKRLRACPQRGHPRVADKLQVADGLLRALGPNGVKRKKT